MRTKNFFLGLTLLLAACAPAAAQTQAVTSAPTATLPSAPVADSPTATPILPLATLAPPTATIEAVATSRGPNLEATDPTTVSLASGGLQLVEFFRFT